MLETPEMERVRELERQIEALNEELWKERAKIQGEAVRTDYEFLRPDGTAVKLSELFGEAEHLVIIHNMGRKCNYCTLWADGFETMPKMLGKSTSFVLVSPDSPDIQEKTRGERNWTFPMVSDQTETFTKDMGMLDENGHWPGATAFYRDPQGNIFRTNQTVFGPGDSFSPIWHLLSLRRAGVNGWEPG